MYNRIIAEMNPNSKRPLKVFLCHAHPDADKVRALYARLKADGVDAWLDKENIIPGQDWEMEIRKAVRESDIVVVCLSKQFSQKGYRQNEVRIALDEANLQPEGEIFVIPARLEECNYLESLKRFHGVDLFEERGYEYLMRALRLRADKIGAVLQSKKTGWAGLTLPIKKTDTQKPKPVVKPQPTPKPEEPKQVVAAFIGVVVIFAVIFGLPWKQWFVAAPDIATVTPTNTATYITPQPTFTKIPSTSTFNPVLPTKTEVPTFTPTTVPLPEEIVDDKGITMRLIPAGAFTMGSNSDSSSDEYPAHEVHLDAYYMDIYKVTNTAYKECVKVKVCKQPIFTSSYNSPDFAQMPVVYINWDMAQTYCEWRGSRLPTEAEWEKAAGSTYEIYDMFNNGSDWVEDWYDIYPGGDPNYLYSYLYGQKYKVLRGGYWAGITNRGYREPSHKIDDQDYYLSFRCARDAEP
ncbi:MAG: SUMF1/EgtB/PvdO family nonheme iron enzyme [Chloroflexi bacterium]|nr:SUMF1/EgtB/PvdO family nonheme iron enzyme [Chloroflexota bacterium]